MRTSNTIANYFQAADKIISKFIILLEFSACCSFWEVVMHCCILDRMDCCCSWGVCGGGGGPPTKGCMAGLAAGLRLLGGMMPMGGRTPIPPGGCAMAGSPLLVGPGSMGEACEGGPIDCPGKPPCCAAAAAIAADACNCVTNSKYTPFVDGMWSSFIKMVL